MTAVTNTSPIWYVSLFPDPVVRMTLGEAKDLAKGRVIEECELTYTGSIESHFDNFEHWVYRVVCRNKKTSWCFSKEGADILAAAKGINDHDIDRYCERAHITPLQFRPVELPIFTYLYRNNKGLYCRLTLHPEIDGTNNYGKLYFPDRSCKDLREGPAIITKIQDKGSYGFFVGQMHYFKAPTDDKIEEYIIEHNLNLSNSTLSYTHSVFGTFIQIKKSDIPTVLVEGRNGETTQQYYSIVNDHPSLVIDKEIRVRDFLCQRHHGCTFDELTSLFNSIFLEPFHPYTSSKFISPLFDRAVDTGFLRLLHFQNIDYVELDSEALSQNLNHFTHEEMLELIQTVNQLNQTANIALKAKIKRGKIRLQ